MGVIGKRMKEFEIEDIWQESEFYGEAVTARVLDGKHYKKCERGHRITLEALERIRWGKFLQWLETTEENQKDTIEKISSLRNEIAACFKQIPEETLEQKGLIIESIREIHYHKENKTNEGKQIEFSAESNHFERKIKSGNK